MEDMGLGYEDLKKIKSEIIMMRTCMHGQTGPLARQPGLGFMLTAISGLAPLTGWPDRPPAGQYFAFTDFVAPLFNAFCLMAALDYRRRTGRGQMLDMAQHESVLRCVGPLLVDAAVNQREYKARGNRMEYAAPHGIFRCKGDDRWCAIAVFTDDEWERFLRVVDNPTITESPKFRTLLDRKRNEDELDKLIEQWTAQHSAEEVMNNLQAAGVAAGIASNSGDLYDDPHLKYYNAIEELEHPDMGKTRIYLRPGFTLSEAPFERSRPPLLGEHNEHVYVNILGIPDDEFIQLMEEGVFD
jgi:benzylsuccinate CoA-transferase BbsF subunit